VVDVYVLRRVTPGGIPIKVGGLDADEGIGNTEIAITKSPLR
jgi:hypothetical protein